MTRAMEQKLFTDRSEDTKIFNHILVGYSRIGFGTKGYHDDSNTCGNEATHSSDNGDKHIKAMGYILVQ